MLFKDKLKDINIYSTYFILNILLQVHGPVSIWYGSHFPIN